MPITVLFTQVLTVAAVILAGIIWLPLALRYRFRKVILPALVVIVASLLIALPFTFYLESRSQNDPLAGVSGEGPSIIVAAGLAGLCNFTLPIICFGTIFLIGPCARYLGRREP